MKKVTIKSSIFYETDQISAEIKLKHPKSQSITDEDVILLAESNISDKALMRKLDCIFVVSTKVQAKKLQDCLRNDHAYNTVHPILEDGEWSVRANKFITITELRDELVKINKLADLINWSIEVDFDLFQNPNKTSNGTSDSSV